MAFDRETYVFNIGSYSNFTCDVANIKDWREIYIHNSSGYVYLFQAKNSLPDVNGVLLSNQSDIQDTYARVVLEFKETPCSSLSDMYTCSVKTDTSWINETSKVIFERKLVKRCSFAFLS